MSKTLILTGWGWKEYPVAAALALKAVGGEADVAGMSRRRLPEFLELYSQKHKQIILIGVSLAETRRGLRRRLRRLKSAMSRLFGSARLILRLLRRKHLRRI